MDDRLIIALDVDCFYAQAEILRRPALRGQPVGVQQKHLVITTSYEARAFGIQKGDSVSEVMRKCPQIVLLNGEDLSYYTEVSDSMRRFVEKFTDGAPVERLGLDELFVDVSSLVAKEPEAKCVGHEIGQSQGPNRIYAASRYADELRRAILEEVGLRTSAGVSSNKLLAKMVSSMHKPFDQTVLVPTEASIRLVLRDDLNLREIPGIGRARAEEVKKNLFGAETVGELLRSDIYREHLVYKLCLGRDDSPVRRSGRPELVGVEDSLWGRPVVDRDATVAALASKLVAKLNADQKGAQAEGLTRSRPDTIGVKVATVPGRDDSARPKSARFSRSRKYEGPDLPLGDEALFIRYASRIARILLRELVDDNHLIVAMGIFVKFPQARESSSTATHERRALADWLVRNNTKTKRRRMPMSKGHGSSPVSVAAAATAAGLRGASSPIKKCATGDAVADNSTRIMPSTGESVDDESVAQLVEMGFSATDAAAALEKQRSFDGALALLLH